MTAPGMKVPNRPLAIGTNVETGEPVRIGLHRLAEHMLVTGPTGCGKTQGAMLKLWEQLAPMPDVSVIAMTTKGDFCEKCADFAIGHGLANSFIAFKPGHIPLGFNPLKRNGWPAERHAKLARTAVLASHGEHSVDEMPQLSRLLFLTLAISLEQGLSLVEAARLLRPGKSPLRVSLLHSVQSEFLREALAWFHDLRDARQDELAASTNARLESFTNDPTIRAILTETECCLNIGDVIKNRKKLCVDCSFYNPLVPDDARTMLRLVLNSILAHKFATPKEERSLTVLLLDEAPQYSTMDLAAALELGRELGLYVVMASQFPSQFKLSKEDTRLFAAVEHCTRTKVVFGGVHVGELEPMVKDLFIDQYNWKTVKDELLTLECEPIESTRVTKTKGFSIGGSLGFNSGTSSSTALTKSRGTSRQWGSSRTHSDALSLLESTATSSGTTTGENVLPSGESVSTVSATEGTSAMSGVNMTSTDSFGESQSQGEQEGTANTATKGTQSGFSAGINGSWNQSWSTAPFYEYIKRWRVSSRTFQTLDEFLTLALQMVKRQPRGHFVIKVPDHKAIFARAYFVRDPWIPDAQRRRALERMLRSLMPERTELQVLPAPQAYQLPAPAVESSENLPAPPEDTDEDFFLR